MCVTVKDDGGVLAKQHQRACVLRKHRSHAAQVADHQISCYSFVATYQRRLRHREHTLTIPSDVNAKTKQNPVPRFSHIHCGP